uniref:Putative membrane glycoprotein lig-1 n=2 Tax=Ixodes ricinus TaxID=34613 RepID=A0A147BU85_IXORI
MATFSHWVWVVVWTQFVLFLTLLSPVDGQRVLCPSGCSCLGSFVDCSRRGLTEIPTDLPTWVEILELQHNNIAEVPPESLLNLTQLRQLDLSHNNLSNLDAIGVQQVPSLRQLKISHNHLIEIPDLGNLQHLGELHLAHNEIQSLGQNLLKYPSLRSLDLSFNKITVIPMGVFTNSSRLLQLSLNSNKVSSIEKGSLDNLTSLETLRLNKNHLVTIPKDLFLKLQALKQLELNKNRIRAIEGLSFKGLESLESLSLRRNSISHLSDGAFYYLGKIQNLNLDFNNITVVTKGWLYGLSALKLLNLTGNSITEVGMDGWEYCRKLTHLDLTFNKLQAITTSTFAKAESLRFLYLGHNMVSYIEEGAFKHLNHLKTLHLDHNEISWTMEDTNGPFLGLSSLVQLTLSDNSIKSLTPRAFAGLGRLQSLDLSGNPVATIHQSTFAPLRRRLTNLKLDSGSLLCDCNLRWLPAWIVSMGFQGKVQVRCGHPLPLQGRLVLDVGSENFTCDDFPKPQILESPETQIALKGQNITLVCRAATASSSTLEFQWRKEQKLLSNVEMELHASAEPNGVTVYTSHLHLRNIQDKDEGRYQCVIRNQFGSVYSNQSHISVYVFPTFVRTPANVTVRAGGTARLECGAQGQPTPTVAWQKDGGDDFPAARERRMHVMPTDDVFFVVGLKAADSGVYTCTAHNPAGMVRASATLTVLEAPAFVRPMKSKQVHAGDSALLECMSSGSPRPKLSWLKDGEPLVPTERHFFAADAQLLVIMESRPSDSGQYACEMANTLGVERGLSVLRVLPAKSPLGPISSDTDGMTTGIVVIVVVLCIVGTSLVWVLIIYKTRKRQRRDCGGALPPGCHPPAARPEHEPFLAAGAHSDIEASAHDLCTDTGSERSSSKESGHRSTEDLASQVDSSSQVFMLGANRASYFMRDQRDDSLSSTSSSNQQTPPTSRGVSSFRPRTGLSSLQTTPRRLLRHPVVLVHGAPPPAAAAPSPGAGVDGTRRCLSEGVLLARASPDRRRARRGSSASSESSGTAGGSSDERDSGFSTFPRSVRSWSSASLHCRLRPREVVNGSSSMATVSGGDSQRSCSLTSASVSQQDVGSAPAVAEPATVYGTLSPGRRRKTPVEVGRKRLPGQPARAVAEMV